MTERIAPLRLLVISFSYRPALNARAFRWTALAERLAADGARVDVVTAWVPGAPEFETVNGVQVHRAGWRWLERMRVRLQRQRTGAKTVATDDGADSAVRRLPARLRNFLVARVWRNLYWPDTSALWYFPARSLAAALTDGGKYDAVVSVSPTFTAVLVGQHATRDGRRARWIMDLGDPFSLQEESPPNNAALYGPLNRFVERRALRAAAAVSVTNQATRELYASAFPEIALKLSVIPPLLSVPEASRTSPFPPGKDRVRLVFVGTLYKGLRAPDFLIRLFAAVVGRHTECHLELHFYGDSSACGESFATLPDMIGRHIFLHGVVDRGVVAAAIEHGDVLVNIGNATAHQLPSKLVEYLASGKPILNIARSSQDSSAQFLASYPDHLTLIDRGGKAGLDDEAALTAFLRGLPRRLPGPELEACLAPHRLDRIVQAYAVLMKPRP
jgi:glycosyltransferase involved in cell wall biosynthesis